MPVLILSSHVAASRVGGGFQALALAALGLEPMLIPTVLFGRHPGLGPPGGAPTPQPIFEGMIQGVRDSGALTQLDAVITGYVASAEQARAMAALIDEVREARPGVRVIVDPIMGDTDTGLYVSEAVARAIAGELAPRADLIAPNAWEAERLAGAPVVDAVSAARALDRPALISSIGAGEEIGVVYADAGEAWFAGHARAPQAPHGTGDLLTALFIASLLRGLPPRMALERSVGTLVESLAAAGEGELPIAGLAQRFARASQRVRLERLA